MAHNGYTEAWVKTEPLALGSWGNPWHDVNLKVEVPGFVDEADWSCVSRVFVRHSPDRRHWTTWQPMFCMRPALLKAEQDEVNEMFEKHGPFKPVSQPIADYKKQIVFACSLTPPRTTRVAYEKLLAEFAATNPPHPRWQKDAVRWILAKDPDYFSREIPFVGYVEFLIEADLGRSPRRLKNVMISATTLVDDLVPTVPLPMDGRVDAPPDGDHWSFVAP